MNEEAAAQQYLLDLLEADGTLSGLVNGVWLKSFPQDVPMPAVRIDRLDAEDVYPIGLNRIWANLTFLVRGTFRWRSQDRPDWTEAREIGDRIDTLLHDHEGTNSEIEVHAFREESFTD